MRYRKGDEVILKIEDTFGYSDRTYRSLKVQIIGYNVDSSEYEPEYIVYVPPYEYLSHSFILDHRHVKHFNIDPKFMGDSVAFIAARHPIYNHYPCVPGERCDKCKEFVEGVERVGSKFTCQSCKLNPYR